MFLFSTLKIARNRPFNYSFSAKKSLFTKKIKKILASDKKVVIVPIPAKLGDRYWRLGRMGNK